jgi:hypothetical protein
VRESGIDDEIDRIIREVLDEYRETLIALAQSEAADRTARHA